MIGAEAKVDAAGHGGIPPVVDARFLQHDGSGMLLQQFHSGVPPPGGRGPQRTKPELSAAADVLLQMSGTPSSNMPTSLVPSEQVCSPAPLVLLLQWLLPTPCHPFSFGAVYLSSVSYTHLTLPTTPYV